MSSCPVPERAPFIGMLVAFGNELRAAGVAVGTGDVSTYSAAVAALDPTDLLDLYWCGRATLLTRREQIPVYDRVFRRFFLDEGEDEAEPVKTMLRMSAESELMIELPSGETVGDGPDDEEATLGPMASQVAVLREKSFAACTPDELAALRRIMARIRLTPPRRCTRRTAPARAGHRPDMRRTVRETLRTHGEPAELFWRRRKLRMRPLVLILDVSGSMSDYSRGLLQFAQSTARAAARVEIFCFGTRLTRITRALERRRPDDAMAEAARAVFDWDGGTRIGDSLETFVRVWGRRGMGRGGIVVICSDGLDRGDPGVLAGAMERLSRLCHRIVWLNPHKGHDADFQPSTLGMMVAAPFVDLLLSGHGLRSREEFAARLPELG